MRCIIVCLVVIASVMHVESICSPSCPAGTQICARSFLNPSNQQTFDSTCALQVHNFNLSLNRFYAVADGACPAAGTAVTCPTTCDTTSSPVTTNVFGHPFMLKTFLNPCELEKYNCAPTNGVVYVQTPSCPTSLLL